MACRCCFPLGDPLSDGSGSIRSEAGLPGPSHRRAISGQPGTPAQGMTGGADGGGERSQEHQRYVVVHQDTYDHLLLLNIGAALSSTLGFEEQQQPHLFGWGKGGKFGSPGSFAPNSEKPPRSKSISECLAPCTWRRFASRFPLWASLFLPSQKRTRLSVPMLCLSYRETYSFEGPFGLVLRGACFTF